MKRIVVYLQPVRTFLPCSGVGRHINGMVTELAGRPDVEVTLLFAKQWLVRDADGRKKLPMNCPLRDLPFRTFSLPERWMERSWKLVRAPKIDRFLQDADVLYCPSDTAFPRTSIPSLVTIHDIHPLDPLYPEFEANPGWNSQRRRWERWVPQSFKTSSAVLTVSEFCKRRMEEWLPRGAGFPDPSPSARSSPSTLPGERDGKDGGAAASVMSEGGSNAAPSPKLRASASTLPREGEDGVELSAATHQEQSGLEADPSPTTRSSSSTLPEEGDGENEDSSVIFPKQGTLAAPIHVIGNGVDDGFFALGRRDPETCRRPGPWPYALVIGGLTDRKGADATLKVAKELQTQKSDLRIVVVGKSEPKWARRAEAFSNVMLCGPLSDEVMGEYLRAASCLLFLSQYEGFGIPIIEAMAAGVPVVCSDTSSLPEVAGDAGWVFPPKEMDEIAEAIEQLAAGGPIRDRRVELGFARASQFTWAACVDRLLEAFDISEM